MPPDMHLCGIVSHAFAHTVHLSVNVALLLLGLSDAADQIAGETEIHTAFC